METNTAAALSQIANIANNDAITDRFMQMNEDCDDALYLIDNSKPDQLVFSFNQHAEIRVTIIAGKLRAELRVLGYSDPEDLLEHSADCLFAAQIYSTIAMMLAY